MESWEANRPVVQMPPIGDATGMMLPAQPSTVPPDKEEFVARQAQVLVGNSNFTPDEQAQLLFFREKLARCVVAFEKVHELLDSEETGLPDAKDKNRCLLGEDSFSIQDARRELRNEWLYAKIQRYVKYVDAALADEVRGAPERGTPERKTPKANKEPRTPDQRASVAAELPAVPKFQPFCL